MPGPRRKKSNLRVWVCVHLKAPEQQKKLWSKFAICSISKINFPSFPLLLKWSKWTSKLYKRIDGTIGTRPLPPPPYIHNKAKKTFLLLYYTRLESWMSSWNLASVKRQRMPTMMPMFWRRNTKRASRTLSLLAVSTLRLIKKGQPSINSRVSGPDSMAFWIRNWDPDPGTWKISLILLLSWMPFLGLPLPK